MVRFFVAAKNRAHRDFFVVGRQNTGVSRYKYNSRDIFDAGKSQYLPMSNLFESLFRRILLGIVLAGVATGCGAPDPLRDLSAADSQVFITNRDRAADFTAYATFSIADSVNVVENDRRGYSADNFDLALINTTAQAMTSRGYTRVTRDQKPDLGVNITFVTQTQTGVTVNPGLGGFYDPFYWGYGGAGAFYPTYYSYYQVSESYWYVELLDLKNVAQNGNKIKTVWNAQIRGSGLNRDPDRIINAIFAQSGYLRKQ